MGFKTKTGTRHIFDGDVKEWFGLSRKTKWPDEGMADRIIQDIHCWVEPISPKVERANGAPIHPFKIRAMCKCPTCGKALPIGRLHQHERSHKQIEVRSGMIGPSHDPYSTTTITVTCVDGRSAEYYQDGLGTHKIRRWDGTSLRDEAKWYDGDTSAEELWIKAFKRHVGITPDAAAAKYARDYEPDPMGSPSDYI